MKWCRTLLLLLVMTRCTAAEEASLAGRWYGQHSSDASVHLHQLLITETKGELIAYGLVYWAVPEKVMAPLVRELFEKPPLSEAQIRSSAASRKDYLTDVSGYVQQEYKVEQTGGEVVLKGVKITSPPRSGKYNPDTIRCRLNKDGTIMTGMVGDIKGNGGVSIFARPEVLESPLPLDLAKGKTHKLGCVDGGKYHYSVYIPNEYDPKTPTPVLIHCSPGGRAKPLSVKMAEKLGWLMVGLRESRNGPCKPATENRDTVMFDLRRRFNIHPQRTYFAGFSGGGDAASRGVVYYPSRTAGVLNCAGYGSRRYFPQGRHAYAFLVGRKDPAKIVTESTYEMATDQGCHARIWYHDGGHAWGPKENIEEAIQWLNDQWGKEPPKKESTKKEPIRKKPTRKKRRR